MRVKSQLLTFLLLVPGGYTQWSQWSVCKGTCGGEKQKRERACKSPSPKHGGMNCSEQGLGPTEEILPCNEKNCPGRNTLNYDS